MKGFTFYVSYWDVAQEISSPEEQGAFYRAVMDYMFAGIDREQELAYEPRVTFKAIKAQLKTSINRSEAGKSGMGNRWSCVRENRNNKVITNHNKVITSSSSSSISRSRQSADSAPSEARKSATPERAEEEGGGSDVYDFSIIKELRDAQ